MYAESIISKSIPSVSSKDTALRVLEMFTEFKLKHIPMVDDGNFLGIIAEDDLIGIENKNEQVGKLALSLMPAFVFNSMHIYEVIKIFTSLHITSIAVLDQNKTYLGLISADDIVGAVALQFSVDQPGGIIVLEIGNRENSLSHIAQVVEADNAQILSSYVNSFPNSTRLTVTLKINKTDITGLVASFERYNYNVKEVFNNTQVDNGSQERFDSFMNYLNV